jgi:hypothetical protein
MDLSNAANTVLSGLNQQVIQIPHPFFKVFIQNHEGHLALLIKATIPADEIVEDGRGFTVKTERDGSDGYLRLTSSSPGISSVFLKLMEFVIEETSKVASMERSIKRIPACIDEFKRFAGRRSGRLSREEIQGLFAELSLLLALTTKNPDSYLVAQSWRGPLTGDGMGLHDFTFPNGNAIEVKSTHQPALEIRVSSPEQLMPSGYPLDLVVLPIEPVLPNHSEGTGLKELIERCRTTFIRDHAALEIFEDTLDATGADLDDEYYDQWKFLPGQWRRFCVSEDFPTLPIEQIPRGIVRITYSLSLIDLERFEENFQALLTVEGEHQ